LKLPKHQKLVAVKFPKSSKLPIEAPDSFREFTISSQAPMGWGTLGTCSPMPGSDTHATMEN